jgi:branched-chain amino acid transport system ATP-binding protein
MMKALSVEDIHTYYGSSHVLQGVSLDVGTGEVVCLLGRNGAGKTTTIRSIMGLTAPSEGRILLFEQDIERMKPYQIFELGIRWVPQGRAIFPMLTVQENLQLALVKVRAKNETEELEKNYKMFPVLKEKRNLKAGTLSGGQLQMLAIARALMGPTKLILMDEPTEGLAPIVIRQIGETIMTMKAQGNTVLLAEQNLSLALSVADRLYIIDKGEIRFHGLVSDLEANDEVQRTYLGIAKKKGATCA